MSTLKNILISSTIMLVYNSYGYANDFDQNSITNEAKTISKIFMKTLKSELKQAMVTGGPLNAIEVCNTKAIPITEEVARNYNVKLRRVSLKNRNPDNTPTLWQKAVLEDFDDRAKKGENIKTMHFSEIVEYNGKKQFRFMKAIPTGDGCLVCHGTNIAPIVQEKLAKLYPEDKATGYKKGQVRGAIVITKELTTN